MAIAPDYIPLLVEIADLLANGSHGLDRAADAARHALELLDRVKAPKRIAPEDWTSAVAKLRARAHTALGMVQFKNDDRDGAMKEFQAALAAGAGDDSILHYRLGRLYAVNGQIAEARRELEHAALSPDKITPRPCEESPRGTEVARNYTSAPIGCYEDYLPGRRFFQTSQERSDSLKATRTQHD